MSWVEAIERAFRDDVAGCQLQCDCGRVFYCPDEGAFTWEEGELDRLEANPNATGVDYAIGHVVIGGRHYADACDCWHKIAQNIGEFVWEHRHAVAKFLNDERAKRIAEAEAVPVVQS